MKTRGRKYLVSRRGKATRYECVDCWKPATDWSRKVGTTGENLSDYDPRCKECRLSYDRIFKPAPMKGKKHTEATKAKIRATLIARRR